MASWRATRVHGCGPSAQNRAWSVWPAVRVVDARVYSGIHFRKADVVGAELGRDVARDGLERAFERD